MSLVPPEPEAQPTFVIVTPPGRFYDLSTGRTETEEDLEKLLQGIDDQWCRTAGDPLSCYVSLNLGTDRVLAPAR